MLRVEDCRNVKCPQETTCLLVKNTGEPFCYPKRHCNPAADPEPVCGTDGITYRNVCAMRLNADKHGRTPEVAHKGRCGRYLRSPPPPPLAHRSPNSLVESKCRANLCQSDERCVYSSQSRPVCIRCPNVARFLAYSGECGMSVRTCGDDGRLYKNYCALLLGQCEKNRYIDIVDYETCPSHVSPMRKVPSRNNNRYMNRFPNFRMK